MDHYKVLGVHRHATKEAIKQAFRKLAVEFHPDKHVNSPPHVRERATVRFKQLADAYDTLMDDRKRADYNIRTSSSSSYNRSSSGGGSYYQHRSSNSGGSGGGYSYTYRRSGSDGVVPKLEIVFRFMSTRAFLLNVAFAGVLFGASVLVGSGGEALWKIQNSGKSFEEAMESIDKAKASSEKK